MKVAVFRLAEEIDGTKKKTWRNRSNQERLEKCVRVCVCVEHVWTIKYVRSTDYVQQYALHTIIFRLHGVWKDGKAFKNSRNIGFFGMDSVTNAPFPNIRIAYVRNPASRWNQVSTVTVWLWNGFWIFNFLFFPSLLLSLCLIFFTISTFCLWHPLYHASHFFLSPLCISLWLFLSLVHSFILLQILSTLFQAVGGFTLPSIHMQYCCIS